MTHIKWGIIGPGAIANSFAQGLAQAPSAELVAIASRSEDRRSAFGDAHKVAPEMRFSDYDAICASKDVDAIYIATPHPWHRELSLKALEAGKHVLCEKPAGMTAQEVQEIIGAASQSGCFFMEAYMYLCHPQIARGLEILNSGEIGELCHIASRFGFAAEFDPKSRLFDKALGGGGILDVGGYVMSFACLFAKGNPTEIEAVGRIGSSGVDETAFALLEFENGVTADIGVAVAVDLGSYATIYGTKGSVHFEEPWLPGSDQGHSNAKIEVTVEGKTRIEEQKHAQMLYAFEAEAASRAILDGKTEISSPAMCWKDSLALARTLDAWRHGVGYKLDGE